jgi:DNA gyrase subunit A
LLLLLLLGLPFLSQQVRSTGRTSRGVRAMKLREGDEIVDMDVLSSRDKSDDDADADGDDKKTKTKSKKSKKKAAEAEGDILVITANGYGKRSKVSDFPLRHRPTMGITSTKFKAPKKKKGPQDRLACLRACSESDEVMITTDAGVIVRQRVSAISRQGRSATGVLVTRLDPGTFITDIALVPSAPSLTEDEAAVVE